MPTPKLDAKDPPALFPRFLCTATDKIRQMLVPVFPVNNLTTELLTLFISVGQNVRLKEAWLFLPIFETANPFKVDPAEI